MSSARSSRVKAAPNEKASRSDIMRAVKGANTKPERLVRRIAHRVAPGYRLNRRDIPGKPDLAYMGRKIAVFVHGCFWHGHDCRRGARVPKDNRDYWLAKIGRNRVRDDAALARLEQEGWRTLVLWECELKDEAAIEDRLRKILSCPS
ncbi:MAG: DNA mismatch endonuclease Vsr [Beijerinckiaceae bacterium]|nr:DNA mismatch endonuclease Vsr [Beijerinckiaceae bacterium]